MPESQLVSFLDDYIQLADPRPLECSICCENAPNSVPETALTATGRGARKPFAYRTKT